MFVCVRVHAIEFVTTLCCVFVTKRKYQFWSTDTKLKTLFVSKAKVHDYLHVTNYKVKKEIISYFSKQYK